MTFQDPLSLIPPLLVFALDPGSDLLALISECGNAKETILVLSECVKRSRNALQVEAVEGEEPDSDGDGGYDESASRKKRAQGVDLGRKISGQVRLIVEAYSAGSLPFFPCISSDKQSICVIQLYLESNSVSPKSSQIPLKDTSPTSALC
jgi:hypothetical protein